MAETVDTWVSPAGKLYDVPRKELGRFCKARELHHKNMVAHIDDPHSDQKNGGWRLVERMRAIGHVSRPTDTRPAIGTLDAFHAACLASTDGRAMLKDKETLGKLLAGTYNNGKPWKKWERRELTVVQMRQLLERLFGGAAELQQAQEPPQMPQQPDFGDAAAAVAAWISTTVEGSRATGSSSCVSGRHQASQGSIWASSAPRF